MYITAKNKNSKIWQFNNEEQFRKHQWKCQRDLIMANSMEDYERQGPFEVVFLL